MTKLELGTLIDRKEAIKKMLSTNVNEHTEKKNNLTYLSWAWAWSEALKADEDATYKVEMFGDKCFMDINGTAMVFVTVTMFRKQMTCQLPVMDYRNKAIPNPDAFAINTAIMRCMTKALSLHGLGLYIYAGEDLPEEGAMSRKGDGPIITPKAGIGDELSNDIKEFLMELAESCKELVDNGRAKEAYDMIKSNQLEADQEVWLSNQMPSNIRSAIKKAKSV
jgi:hypothetical protein